MHHLLRRGALVAATALTAGLLTAPAAQAADPSPSLAADWLTTQLDAGIVVGGYYDQNDMWVEVPDYGLTLDAAFALQATGGHEPSIGAIDTALQAHVPDYITGGAWAPADRYAGAIAKLAVFVQSINADPTTYGGTDLVKQLNRRVSNKTVIKGRIQDKSQYGDYANVIGQAFAVRALKTAGTGKAGAALGFLLEQQCREGYFRLSFKKSTTSRKQSCNAGNPATLSAPDTDATAVAVLQLQATKGKNLKTKKAIAKAVRWLKSTQKKHGAFGGGTSTEAPNTNSTGLAGWALGATGSCGAAQDAAEWVARWQVLEDAAPLTGELGAVAYDKAGWTAGQADGVTVGTRDQWRRATAQAAPALTNLAVADCRAR